MKVLYHPDKSYVVADALYFRTISRVSHIDEAKKDLAKKVQRLARLGVRLKGSPNGGAIVHHNSNSSLVFAVKSKQRLDKSLMEFKEAFHEKLSETFSLGGWYF